MRHLATLAALLVAFCFTPAFAAESDDDDDDTEPQRACPFAVGTFTDSMANRVVYTTRAGYTTASYSIHDTTEVSVSLKHVLPTSWTCATWSAELLLLDEAASKVGASEFTGLTHSSVATFVVRLEHGHNEASTGSRSSLMSHSEMHVYRAVLAVTVYNGSDTPVFVADKSDAQGRWHFPVDLVLERS